MIYTDKKLALSQEQFEILQGFHYPPQFLVEDEELRIMANENDWYCYAHCADFREQQGGILEMIHDHQVVKALAEIGVTDNKIISCLYKNFDPYSTETLGHWEIYRPDEAIMVCIPFEFSENTKTLTCPECGLEAFDFFDSMLKLDTYDGGRGH